MTRRRDVGPERIRSYRIEAEPRQSPDLHKLVQLFIGMARSRAEQDRTTPATSEPGMKGRGGEIWYLPRVWSTSGNVTPAAWTSIRTAPGSGSGRSTTSRAAGPSWLEMWMARMRSIVSAHPRARAPLGSADARAGGSADARALRRTAMTAPAVRMRLLSDIGTPCRLPVTELVATEPGVVGCRESVAQV